MRGEGGGGVPVRARLEAEAATIIGSARAEATDIVQRARDEAAAIHSEATLRRVEADELRERARRQLVQAEEQALSVRAAAERAADAILEGATSRAREEAEALLAEARKRLARALSGEGELEAVIDLTLDADHRIS